MISRTSIVLLTLFTALPAHSQVTDQERAIEYFRLSAIEYDAGNFSEAVSLLRQALRLHDEPVLHYNLARALEAQGELAAAVESYERYLEMDDDPEVRGAVESRLRALRRQLEEREQLQRERDEARAAARAAAEREREAASREAARSEDPPTEAPTDPVDPPDDDGSGGSVAPWLVMGSGVLVAGGGMVFALLGQKRHDDAVAHPTHRTAARLDDEASTFATLANAFFIAGGVIAAGGLIWGLLTLGGDDEESTAIRVGPGGLELRTAF